MTGYDLFLTRVLFIGDSFTSGGGASAPEKRWTTVLSERQGWFEYNYAVGGAGFVGKTEEGNNYLQQTQRAAADGVQPDIIIVSGGQNDYASNTTAAIGAWIDFVHATWPAARVVAVPGTYRAVGMPLMISDRYWDWITAFEAKGVEYIPHAWQWLYGRYEWMAAPADPNHPNDIGHAVIASKVALGLVGKSTLLNTGRFALPAGPGYVNQNAWCQVIEGVAHVWGGLSRATGSIAAGDTPFNVAAWWAPGAAARRVAGLTRGGDNPNVSLVVTPAGYSASFPARIANLTGVADGSLILPATSWPIGA